LTQVSPTKGWRAPGRRHPGPARLAGRGQAADPPQSSRFLSWESSDDHAFLSFFAAVAGAGAAAGAAPCRNPTVTGRPTRGAAVDPRWICGAKLKHGAFVCLRRLALLFPKCTSSRVLAISRGSQLLFLMSPSSTPRHQTPETHPQLPPVQSLHPRAALPSRPRTGPHG
jgi:hypothetical protein